MKSVLLRHDPGNRPFWYFHHKPPVSEAYYTMCTANRSISGLLGIPLIFAPASIYPQFSGRRGVLDEEEDTMGDLLGPD